MTRSLLLVVGATLAALAPVVSAFSAEAELTFSHEVGKESRVVVRGFRPDELRRLEQLQSADKLPDQLLQVYVANENEDDAAGKSAVPLFGNVALEDAAVVFRPRYPFLEGVAYRAIARRGVLRDAKAGTKQPMQYRFSIPAPDRKPTTELVKVYPTSDVLPENQLKFYLHFSAPMSRGGIYRHLHLLRADGSEVDLPFLELGEELWDSSGQRLTVLFDPGRIKRGLKPREEEGPVLEEGRTYTFVVDRAWHDAKGQPLVRSFRKRFKSAAPDDTQPDPQHWKFDVPPVASRQPLTVTFREPLDHAMLQRVLTVRGPGGDYLEGAIEVDRRETRWRFTPRSAWRAGDYKLVVATTLEDRAGNSIGRPFEVDIFNKVDRTIDTPTVSLPFAVKSAK